MYKNFIFFLQNVHTYPLYLTNQDNELESKSILNMSGNSLKRKLSAFLWMKKRNIWLNT